MATATVQIPHAPRFTTWFASFLRSELAPYPGRGAIVARMLISATISAALVVVFRIPGGIIGVLCAFVLSREDLFSTAKSAFYIVAAFAIGGLFVPVGARFFASTPMTHFLWEAVSLFVVFFLIKTLTNYALATGLSLVVTNILAIWYLPGPADHNVELTLWQVGAALIGALVTLTVEIVFHSVWRGDVVVEGLDIRLKHIEDLMRAYAENLPAPEETTRMLGQYFIVGMGAFRRHIARTTTEPLHRLRLSALVSLTGRSIDFAAALSTTAPPPVPELARRAGNLARGISELRHCLRTTDAPCMWQLGATGAAGTPLFSELESMIALMPSIFSSETSIDPNLEILESDPSSHRIFAADAFTNPEHLRYTLSGTLAAMICYVLYVSLAWPGISTAVTTCVLTALSSIGASRQKQVLRVAGAIIGGFGFGLGAQIFVLPYIDSISGFLVLFAAVTAIAAWFSTSSSRLSYAGLQMALAFYLITLSEFSIQTSLTVARDRAIGVLLGTFMMWIVFDRFYPKPAGDEMVRIFIANLRLMADMVTASSAGSSPETIVKLRRQRDQAYRQFGDVTAQSDAVPFETGATRAAHMAARDRIRRWQASLRTFYLMETPLIQFRLFGDLNQKSLAFSRINDRFRQECAESFEHMAASLEAQLSQQPFQRSAPASLLAPIEASQNTEAPVFTEREQALMRMLRSVASLVDRLQAEVATEPLYATE